MFLVHHAGHLLPFYLERCTGGNGSGGHQTKPAHTRERLLSDEVAGAKKRNRGFFAVRRNHSES